MNRKEITDYYENEIAFRDYGFTTKKEKATLVDPEFSFNLREAALNNIGTLWIYLTKQPKKPKQVFTNKELAHIWASQSQATGRTSNSAMYFEDNLIYSYGSHYVIGRILEVKGKKVCLINSTSYSPSTSQHTSDVRSAVRHMQCIHLADPMDIKQSLHKAAENHVESLFNLFCKNTAWSLILTWRLEEITKHNEACDLFNFPKHRVDVPLDLLDLLKVQVRELVRKTKLRDSKRDERHNAKLALREVELAGHKAQAEIEIQAWLLGGPLPEYARLLNKVYVRVKGNVVETSDHAEVPLDEALTLMNCIEAGIPVSDRRIGAYTVTSFDGKTLVVGCHKMDIEQVRKAFASVGPKLKLVEGE